MNVSLLPFKCYCSCNYICNNIIILTTFQVSNDTRNSGHIFLIFSKFYNKLYRSCHNPTFIVYTLSKSFHGHTMSKCLICQIIILCFPLTLFPFTTDFLGGPYCQQLFPLNFFYYYLLCCCSSCNGLLLCNLS